MIVAHASENSCDKVLLVWQAILRNWLHASASDLAGDPNAIEEIAAHTSKVGLRSSSCVLLIFCGLLVRILDREVVPRKSYNLRSCIATEAQISLVFLATITTLVSTRSACT